MDIYLQLKQSLGETARLHHAHFIVGPKEEVKKALFKYLESTFSIEVAGNQDILSFSFDVMGVDEGRSLSSAARITSVAGRRFIVVETNFLTREAQNALLKSLEEPIAGTFFFFIVPQLDTILATVRSRVVVHALIDSSEGEKNEIQKRAENFLRAPIAKRMKMIKEFASEISDDEKSRADVIVFLAELERMIKLESSARKSEQMKVLADIAMAKKYLMDRAPSVKMLLEHIALSLS